MSRICTVLLLLLVVGCAKKDEPYRKPTFPVTGTATVDGKTPDTPMQIHCHPVGAIDTENPTFSQTETKPDGSFAISTYESGDGIPPGEYTITISWQEFNLMTRSYSGPDKLKGAYDDPKTSKFTFTVKDQPVDLGALELTIPKD